MSIDFCGKKIDLVTHVIGNPVHGEHRNEAGIDAAGAIYFKGRNGGWTLAYQTRELAEKMVGAALDRAALSLD